MQALKYRVTLVTLAVVFVCLSQHVAVRVEATSSRKISIVHHEVSVDVADGAPPCACGYEPLAGIPGKTCVACSRGSYSSGTRCIPCLANTVAPNPGSCACQPCGPGTQARSPFVCSACPEGTYSNDNATCKQCPDGSVTTTTGATSCQACSTILSRTCGIGSYGRSCSLCSIGMYGPSATSGCIPCPAVRCVLVCTSQPLPPGNSQLSPLSSRPSTYHFAAVYVCVWCVLG